MFPNRYPTSFVGRATHIRSHFAKVSRRIQIATVKRTYVHGGGMEVGIHRFFRCLFETGLLKRARNAAALGRSTRHRVKTCP
jgi:hypothetical protein